MVEDKGLQTWAQPGQFHNLMKPELKWKIIALGMLSMWRYWGQSHIAKWNQAYAEG